MKKIFLAITVLFALMPLVVRAETCDCTCNPNSSTQPTTINYSASARLSELLPDPDETNKEFIEIENLTANPLSIVSWILSDASAKRFVIASVIIPPKGFATIDKSISGISLNNTGGETITLASPDGVVQDTVMYTGTVKKNWSYSRTASGWSWTTTPTPGKANAIKLPNTAPVLSVSMPKNIRQNTGTAFTVEVKDADGDDVDVIWEFSDGQKKSGPDITLQFSSAGSQSVLVKATDERGLKTEKSITFKVAPFDPAANVLLNELYPKPKTGEVEWIEITNTNERGVALAGWQLTDGVTTYAFPEDAQIAASEFLAIDKTDTNIALNDTGDTVTLIKPDETTADTITYDKATAGKSFAKFSTGWSWGDPTKNAANEGTTPKVLGESVGAASDKTHSSSALIQKNPLQIVQSDDYLRQYGPYAALGSIVCGLGFVAFRKWRIEKKLRELEQE